MPKIIVREIDKTKAGSTEYSNFAVLVPGFSSSASPTGFDDNDVQEFYSQDTFISTVGKKAAETAEVEVTPAVARVFATVTLFETAGQQYASPEIFGASAQSTTMVFDETAVATYADTAYTEIITTSAPAAHLGYLIYKDTEISGTPEVPVYKKYTKVASPQVGETYAVITAGHEGRNAKTTTKQFTAEDTITYKDNAYTEEITTEPASDKGKLFYKDTAADGSDDAAVYKKYTKVATPQAGSTYAVLTDEGSDEVPAETKTVHQMGNQIAYELLGMGYPVIYKLIKPAEGKTFYDVLNDPTFWEPMKDKSLYDFRYIVNGMLDYNTLANGEISKLASYNNSAEVIGGVSASTGRGDCTALCDIGEDIYNISNKTISEKIKLIKAAANSQTNADKYTAICANSVTYGGTGDTAYESNLKFPASFHYLACAVKATENYAEWYAVSGYNRGYANRTVESTLVKLGDAAVNILQPRNTTSQAPSTEDPALTHAVNIVVKQKDGYYFWGNRTAETLTTTDLVASHFLNIRQLCTTIKKQLYTTCRQLAFEPNSEVLWNTFRSKIEPLLDKMKADQGIKDYRILKIADSRKALLKAKVRIIPIEAVEDFDISLYLEDDLTGADIEEG